MRSRSVINWVVAALGVCLIVAPQPAQAVYGDILVWAAAPSDANVPVPAPGADPGQSWDPAAHVVASWESLTSMSKLYNPAGSSGVKAPERSLSLSARVEVIDTNGLLGFDSTAVGTLVLDEKGHEVHRKAVPSRYCRFYWPLRYVKKMPTPGTWVSELQPYNFSVNMPMDPNRPYPLVLSRVEWSMYALVSTQVKTVDIPFQPTADWLLLAPGLEIKVEETKAESTKYQYRIAIRYNHGEVVWAPSGAAISLWTHEPTPEPSLTRLDILDPLGRSIQEHAAGGAFSAGAGASGSDGLMTGTASGGGSCDICGTATTFRFTLALKPAQQELRFALQNVPVPIL